MNSPRRSSKLVPPRILRRCSSNPRELASLRTQSSGCRNLRRRLELEDLSNDRRGGRVSVSTSSLSSDAISKLALTLQTQHVPSQDPRPPLHSRLLLALQDLPLPLSRHPANRFLPPLESLLLPLESFGLEEISDVEDGESQGVLLPRDLLLGERRCDAVGCSSDDG